MDLESTFQAAADYVSVSSADFSSDKLLLFYGYYKQATHGSCDTPKPGYFDFKNKQKWEAWNKLGELSKEEAMQKYIELITTINPQWEDSKCEGIAGWVTVSRFCPLDEEEIPQDKKTAFDFVKDNNLSKIKSCHLDDLKCCDDDGMTPLLWAADRGYNDILIYILDQGIDINHQDKDGQTALHYAVSCEHENIINTLIGRGANVQVKDYDGIKPFDLTNNESILSLLSNDLSVD